MAKEPYGELAMRQGFVLATDQLRAFGIERHVVRREVRRGNWFAPVRGVVAPLSFGTGPQDLKCRHALVTAASALLRRGQAASGCSAAVLYGLPVFALPKTAQLTDGPDGTLGARAAAHVYGATLELRDIGSWFGVPTTVVSRTIVDLARHNRRDGLLTADAALREGLVTEPAIAKALENAAGWPGVRQARAVLSLASEQAESPLETLVRLALHDAGLPAPELQIKIGGYRVDFLWRKQRLILEADGRVKYTDQELWREKRREMRLTRLGYRVIRVTWWDLTQNWPETCAHIAAELAFPAGVVSWTRSS